MFHETTLNNHCAVQDVFVRASLLFGQACNIGAKLVAAGSLRCSKAQCDR
jgi:hypothetical protein